MSDDSTEIDHKAQGSFRNEAVNIIRIDSMGIKDTIGASVPKKSARGIADVGHDYFSQVIEFAPPHVHKRNKRSHDALEAAKKKKNQSPPEIDAAFEKVWELLKEPVLNLKIEEIQKKQNSARENDAKTQARLVPIMKMHEIKKITQANPLGKDVRLKLVVGATKLTGSQYWIYTEPFGNNHTLSTVLWLLIQSGSVRMDQNPHFYSAGLLDPATFNRHFKTGPLSFDKKLGTKDVLVLHVLVDTNSRLVLQSQDPSFYRNFGNIWSPSKLKDPIRIVKHFDGTLEATNWIDSQISESRLALRLISGSASTSQAGKNIWDDYLMPVSRNIVGQKLPAILPTDDYEEISGEDTEPEEEQDSSEDATQEEPIQAAPQRQTRLQIRLQQINREAEEAKEAARVEQEQREECAESEKRRREAEAAERLQTRLELNRSNRKSMQNWRGEEGRLNRQKRLLELNGSNGRSVQKQRNEGEGRRRLRRAGWAANGGL
ncbi:hypothetical protein FIBSPDRAFT_881504 [Athelia psychrophila]|uniref:Uncharacterized protein n=1 Tax=Athelia psychrophila TaxID=1759441 RepID=A0A166WS10_9AGAM|nr:hypothetical protein FIBSPDRAFT_881504 [Fibularhizoctonia sp. CBS 109695]